MLILEPLAQVDSTLPLDPPGQATLRKHGPEQRISEPEDSERLEPADQADSERWDGTLILQRMRPRDAL